MGTFCLVLPRMGRTEEFERAETAYRWLDDHAREGDVYQLFWLNYRTGDRQVVVDSVHVAAAALAMS